MSRVIHVSSHPSQGSDDYDGSRERPVLTFGRALEISRYGDVIAYDGVLGSMVPLEPEPDGNPLVGTAWLLAIFGGSWLAVAALIASGFLFWYHPRAFLVAVIVAAVVLLGLLVPASRTADPELDEINRAAL